MFGLFFFIIINSLAVNDAAVELVTVLVEEFVRGMPQEAYTHDGC